MKEIAAVTVIGAGQMGAGIAQVCAGAGISVSLNDVDAARVSAGKAAIAQHLDRQVNKARLGKEERDATLARVTEATDLAKAAQGADMVIEAAIEDEAVKRAIFDKLKAVVSADTIIASNTSSLSITRLAAATDRPTKFIGLHFMNPVPAMKLVELIRGIQTDDETFETAKALIARLGKIAAVAEDFPAFIVNRILLPMINEACYTLYEGVGTVSSIDAAMKLGANHPMGPFELADFIGLDTCLAIMRVLHDELADTKYRPCPLLVKYVEAGWLGRKTGRGFYDYASDPPTPTR